MCLRVLFARTEIDSSIRRPYRIRMRIFQNAIKLRISQPRRRYHKEKQNPFCKIYRGRCIDRLSMRRQEPVLLDFFLNIFIANLDELKGYACEHAHQRMIAMQQNRLTSLTSGSFNLHQADRVYGIFTFISASIRTHDVYLR